MDLVTALKDPEAYDFPVDRVEHLQTHLSHLFFAADYVFKVKKPVDLGFVDYTELPRRQHFCAAEVELNRRLAGDVYLGVTPIRVRADGRMRIGSETAGTIVDYAVQMRRLPADRMLDRLLDAADIDNEKMRQLGDRLVRFHAEAATGPEIDRYGAIDAVRGNCAENFAQVQPFRFEGAAAGPHGTISARLLEFLTERTMTFLTDRKDLFDQRVAEGRIRDGHGDLHAGNICVLPDRIIAYDCIEFAPRFRCGDVAADLAFLLMDMDLRRFRGFAGYLQHEYVRASGDAQLPELIPFYKGYRAFVRGKVTSMGLADLDGAERESARDRAASYFHLAASYELPPALIVSCGLPGSGKSYIARHLAGPLGAAILSSDRTRKRQAGLTPTQRAGTEIDAGVYGAEQTDATYAAIVAAAATELEKGRTVIIDAGCRTATLRYPFEALAKSRGAPFALLHASPSEAVVHARLAARAADPTAESDAGIEVYEAVKARFEPPTELPPDRVVCHGETDTMVATTHRLIDALIGQV